MATLLQRFEEKVCKQPEGCWEWVASKNPAGYGLFHIKKGCALAHRVAYTLYVAEIPEGRYEVMHSCDNPGCVNPSHLSVGLHIDNMADRVQKGRAQASQRKRSDLKLTAERAEEVKAFLAQGMPQRHIAKRFGISQGTVTLINRGKMWAPLIITQD